MTLQISSRDRGPQPLGPRACKISERHMPMRAQTLPLPALPQAFFAQHTPELLFNVGHDGNIRAEGGCARVHWKRAHSPPGDVS